MRIIAFIFFQLIFSVSNAQVFWTENFNNGCNASCPGLGYTGINGTWTHSITGAEGSTPNIWYVSCAENGMPVGSCGAPCGANATMHMGSTTLGDLGAAYDAGGLCFIGFCPQTNRRIQSPVINCTGYTTITLNFNYIENGQGTTDDGTVWYFDGVTWAQIDNPPKTATGCGGQGIWALRTLALPASANNNASVKIGFRWVNNDDGVGTDPSFAIDDAKLSVASLPIELISFTAESANEGIKLNWELMNEGEMNGYAIERSDNGIAFSQITFVKENSQARSKEDFKYIDASAERGITYYYRLKSLEKDGSFKNSPIVTAKLNASVRDITVYYSNGNVILQNSKDLETLTRMEVIDVQGKTILCKTIDPTLNENTIDVSQIQAGIYFCRISNSSENVTVKLPIW